MKPTGAWSESSQTTQLFPYRYLLDWISPNWSYGQWSETRYNLRTGYNSGPGWKALASVGELPPRSASLIRDNQITIDQMASVHDSGKLWGQSASKTFLGVGSITPAKRVDFDQLFGTAPLASLRNEVNARLVKKILATSFDSLTFMGEYAKTRAYIASLSSEIAQKTYTHEDKLLHELRVGKLGVISTPAKLLDVASRRWLEFAYAIKPMFKDMEDLGEAFAKLTLREQLQQPKAREEVNFSKTITDNYGLPGIGIVGSRSRTYTRRCEVRQGTTLLATDPYFSGQYVQRQLGMDPSNILPALWELVPWSFLVDYFTNVGDLISVSTSRLPSLHHTWGVELIEDTVSWDCHVTHSSEMGLGWHITGQGDRGHSSTFSFNRIVDPKLEVNLEFNNWDKLSRLQKLNVSALAYSLAGRAKVMQYVLQKIIGYNY